MVEQLKNIKIDCFNFDVNIPEMNQVYSQSNYDLVYSFLNNNIDSVDQFEESDKTIANSFSYIKHYFMFHVVQPNKDNQNIYLDISNLILKVLPTQLYNKTVRSIELSPIAKYINILIINHNFIDSIPTEIGKTFTRKMRFPRGDTQLVKRYVEKFLFNQRCLYDDNNIEFVGEYDCDYYNKNYIRAFDRARHIFLDEFDIKQSNISNSNSKLTVRFFKNHSDWKRFGGIYFQMNSISARSFYIVEQQTINTYETPEKTDTPSYKKILTHEYLHHVHASLIGKQMMNDASFFWLREAFIEHVLLNDIKNNNPDKVDWLQEIKKSSVPTVRRLIESSYKDTNMQYTFGPVLLNLLANDSRYKEYFERLLQVQVEKDFTAYKDLMFEIKNDADLQNSFKMEVERYKNN